jgi:hypothetical protein
MASGEHRLEAPHGAPPRQQVGDISVGNQGWGAIMVPARPKSSFICPRCKAMYQVITEEAGPETVYSEITACGGPLPNREGKYVLKYFLLRKGARFQQRAGK